MLLGKRCVFPLSDLPATGCQSLFAALCPKVLDASHCGRSQWAVQPPFVTCNASGPPVALKMADSAQNAKTVFGAVLDFALHERMRDDAVRCDAFDWAIARQVEGRVVLDIGVPVAEEGFAGVLCLCSGQRFGKC